MEVNSTSSVQDTTPVQKELTADDLDSLYNFALAERYKSALKIANSSAYVRHGICSKDDIARWLKNPAQFEKHLRSASRYMYEQNGQYRRLCNYQPNMVKFAYVITPTTKLGMAKNPEDIAKYKESYLSTALALDNMNIKTEFRRPLAVAAREGVAFCYARSDGNAFCLHVMDADYCRASSFDMFGCIHYEFNFAYFDMFKKSDRRSLLEALGQEFIEKYALYCEDRTHPWKEIDPNNGLCIKWDSDILQYSTPPYIAVLDTLFDIEDYKKLAKAKEEAGNYNLMGFTIPTTKDGKILMDLPLAKKFVQQASSELPSTIGVLLSPMQMEKFNFSKPSVTADQNAVAEAEEQFWSASGVPSLLFGTSKSSANALAKSIIADEINILPLVHQIERWINRRLSMQRGKYKFKIRILDITAFNQSDMFDLYMKAGNAGLPVKNALAATTGLTPYEAIAMAELENEVLQMRDYVFNQPLVSTNTMTSNDVAENVGGRPTKDDDDLSPEGEATRETDGNIRE